jgi:hypothetical protein
MADSFMQQLITSLARRTPILDEEVPPSRDPSTGQQPSPQRSGSALRAEDRPDFERTVDEALADMSAAHIAGGPGRLTSEQLRTMALTAANVVAASAAPEYAHYIMVRERFRQRSSSTKPADPVSVAPASVEGRSGGAGLVAVMAVLAPLLAGTVALIFLLIGYGLRLTNGAKGVASPLITSGWVAAAVAAASVLLSSIGLLLTALRNVSTSPHEAWAGSEEVAEARDAWRAALRERGVEPFLREVRRAVNRGAYGDSSP